jgi:large subunit ribosomal protein L17
MIANMAASLIEKERVITTPQKAKEVRRFVERLVTLSKRGGVAERRMAEAMLHHHRIPGISSKGHPASVDATQKLFGTLAGRFKERNGGYTRIVHLGGSRRGQDPVEMRYKLGTETRTLKLAGNRLGDNAEQVILEFVDVQEAIRAVPEEELEKEKEKAKAKEKEKEKGRGKRREVEKGKKEDEEDEKDGDGEAKE